ncbi:MAG: hypothetical protein KatS3mg089_0715 [Patescibacteria group bacterium]|nr:MAG: hypothetical protein KatS3mg089_0715 [Patescibacteria group bacterium]
MKNFVILIIIGILFIGRIYPALAVTPTSFSAQPTSESTVENLSSQINKLKEKIATRVAQLKLVEKRGIVGTVQEINGMVITLSDVNNKIRIVDVDEITKFSSNSKESFGISDIKRGDKLSVIGLYNKDSQRILARFITKTTIPVFISGTLSNRNNEDFTITVVTGDLKRYLVDIEKVTKTNVFTGDQTERSGFSKLSVGERIVVIGYPHINERNRIVATRVIHFPTLPKNPKIVIPENSSDETVPSTGSGKKLTPIR